MRWSPGGRSRNLEDRRGGGLGAPLGIGGTVILLVLGLIFGQDFLGDAQISDGPTAVGGALAPEDSAREEPAVQFVSFVLDDAQRTWQQKFAQAGEQYREAKLVLFRNGVQSACGVGQSAMGPFYCPLDEKVYVDLGFFDELRTRFGAPGDFAQAYVLAHEIGHHVQTQLGISERVRQAQQQNPRIANELSVRQELQADCYAGVWGHSTAQREILERGDVEEGLGAAAAVGDDRIQQQTTGRVNVDAFTHGSAEQRASWFRRGLSTGDPNQCDAFSDLSR
ncbi:MAG TPA: neutral zinc metallopeptidase [Gemmatimonadaceae bacterium]|nr:neutral zinc metallopeptidase [Gemmatimonadaceae bacterium]